MRVHFRLDPRLNLFFGFDEETIWENRTLEIPEGESLRGLLERLVAEESRFAQRLYDPTTSRVGKEVMITLNGLFLELSRGGLDGRLCIADRIAVVPGHEE